VISASGCGPSGYRALGIGASVIGALLCGLVGGATAQAPPGAADNSVKKAHAEFLADADLAAGILRVSTFLAERDRPIVHVVITARPSVGEPVQARTDARGVATIGSLKPGKKYKVEAVIQNEIYATKEFTMPAKTGLSIALSPVPPKKKGKPGSGDARPNPSRMHGQMRGQEGDKAGTLTVRVLRGSWNHNAPKVKIHLVGYHSSGKISHLTAMTDAAGRARFTKLDRSRSTAYYAYTVMARKNKDGPALASKAHEGYDRLTSRTLQMPPKVGGRMVLSGSTPDNTDPAWDNNTDLFGDRQWDAPKPGEVQVEISGGARGINKLELIKAGGSEVVAVAQVGAVKRRARNVRLGRSQAFPMSQLPVGTVYIRVTRPEGIMTRNPPAVPTAKLELIDASTNAVVPGRVVGAANVFTKLKPGGIYTWKLSVFGRKFEGKPFEVNAGKGMFIPVPVDFQLTSAIGAMFKGVVGGNDAVYVVRARRGGNLFQSRPFQLTPTKGAFAKIDIGQRVRYAFDFQARLDDNQVIYQGHFIVANVSWFPYKPKDGRYVFHLPKGFKGATVHGNMANVVKVVREKGFGWSGALPPRGASFRGAWILLVEDGEMRFDLDLPNGAVGSKIQLQQVEGMNVKLYGNIKGKTFTSRSGDKWFLLDNLTIAPGKAIVMDVAGLPRPPTYQKYVRWTVGLAVVSLLIFGLFGVFRARSADVSPGSNLQERREALLEKLVAMERKHSSGDLDDETYSRGKAALVDELEKVYKSLEPKSAKTA